jgi:hypothetical protein
MTTQPAKNRNTPNSMAHSMLMKLCPIRNVNALHSIQQTGQLRKAASLSATMSGRHVLTHARQPRAEQKL